MFCALGHIKNFPRHQLIMNPTGFFSASHSNCLNNAALCSWLAALLHILTALTVLNVNGLFSYSAAGV